ncbi:MAG: hypothetical protein KF889_01400 [Alphaproteobacteria bacterium]|nr:hypothetical protein [Alphaproteobacteria bacterium]MCW5741558.1 hypothetical protein [Alphaproteobacteria bacterium]
MSRHHPRPFDPHAAVPERDFVDGYATVYGMTHADPERLRLMKLNALGNAFPSHPALPRRILLRLNALAEVWRHPMMDAWRDVAGNATLSSAALRIAATQPLCDDGRFNAESFFAEMLRRMNEKGWA